MEQLEKTGRNSPCPCGSGKKYKKCCLGQNELISFKKTIKTSDDQRISDFAYIEPNAMKIFDRIKKYKFEDLIRAVFCLNLWRRNRSALAQGLTLHKALSTKDPFGEQPIDSYDEFQQFFENIIDLLPITPMQDFIIDDYGEVFISHEGEAFPIIIGNGYNQGYATVRYLQTLADTTDNGHNLREILSYIRHIIAFTKETNMPNEGYTISYELPSEDFWKTIKELFKTETFKKQCVSVANIFDDCVVPIESLHFIQKTEGIYPVYNSGILVDYYHKLLSEANEQHKRDHVLQTIYDMLDSSFNLSHEPPNRVLISPIVLDMSLNRKIIPNKLCFATTTKEYVIIGIDRSQFNKDSDVNKCIEKINHSVKEQGVCLIEPFMRDKVKGSCGIKLDSSANILFMLIDTFIDATTHANWFETENNKWMNCTAFDLIYLLGFSKDWDEIVQYMLHENADKTQVLSIGGKSNHFFTWKNSNRLISDGAFEADFLNVDFNETEFSTYWFFKESISEFPKTGKGLYRDPLNWTTREGVLGYSSISHKGCHGFAGVTKELCLGTYVFLAHNVEFFSEDDFIINGHTAINTIDELNQRLFLRYDKIIGEFDVVNGKTLQILYMPWSYAIKNHPTEFIADSNRHMVYSDECVYEDSVIIRYSVDCERLLKELKEAKDRTAENAYFRELVLPLAKYDPEKFNMLDEQLCFDNKLKKQLPFSN